MHMRYAFNACSALTSMKDYNYNYYSYALIRKLCSVG